MKALFVYSGLTGHHSVKKHVPFIEEKLKDNTDSNIRIALLKYFALRRIGIDCKRQIVVNYVKSVVAERAEFIKERGKAALGPVMGVIMKEVRGKIDGKVVSEVLDSELKKYL